MKIDEQDRQALIVALTQRVNIGRTALMKLMFFLQELRGVQLCYDFRIYTYGPYDAQVLEDLRLTEAHGGTLSKQVVWSGGSGVEISAGSNAKNIMSKSSVILEKLSADLDWVTAEFGKRTASDLEVLSTIIFVDREIDGCVGSAALATKVHTLKPHHSLGKIIKEVENMDKRGLLQSVC